jgi:DNA polymerase III epsilon subunit-like protein
VVDTVKLSRRLAPHLPNHKLATYGDLLGFPKLPFHEFETFTPEMAVYMERDVRLNALVWEFLWELLSQPWPVAA